MSLSLPEGPHLFALPPGADFARAVVDGLLERLPPDPLSLARTEIFTGTRRMQRQLHSAFQQDDTARLLPRIRLVTDPGTDPTLTDLPPSQPALRRRLELTQIIAPLLRQETELDTGHATFALAESLDALLAEMRGEGVSPARLEALDVSDESGHWTRALNFVTIASEFVASRPDPDPETRQRAAIEALIARWQASPPNHPVIVAGSTGSRGTTALLMEAVARLPQGAVILPGVDGDLPPKVWQELRDPLSAQDHPQYRFASLAARLGLDPYCLPEWCAGRAPSPARNRLISLALRPAPVTDSWRREGPAMGDLGPATEGLTLIEAPSPRIEAEAIALVLRDAVERGVPAALITPDRGLTRQVAASLDRYGIVPDDSAGEPLHMTPPGRLLRQMADALQGPVGAEPLLSLLKHPLAHSHVDRGPHLQHTRALELHIRRNGPPHPTPESMAEWATKHRPEAAEWAAYVGRLLIARAPGERPLPERCAELIALTEALCGGTEGSGRLWEGEAGQAAARLMAELAQHAEAGVPMTAGDFSAMLTAILSGEELRQPVIAHPLVRIWGTLEARVQSAPLVIIGGLNEDAWPAPPSPDPWLNRRMRAEAGMLLPDRQIGLMAHDFQQAAGAREVVLTRSKRSEEAETVPSRWLNRLNNLLAGLPEGAPRLKEMRARGARWLAGAAALDRPASPLPPAKRPAPRPPVEARPKRLRVTDISTLNRDPYALYARLVLRLDALNPLEMSADARLKGIAIHEVMERLILTGPPLDSPNASATLMQMAEEVLARISPWATARRLWLAQLAQLAPDLLRAEALRAARAVQSLTETKGAIDVPGTGVTIHGRADRIDLTADGAAWLYDYKTGNPPTKEQQKSLDKQLLVEAAMVEQGGFAEAGRRTVAGAVYLKIGNDLREVPAPLEDLTPAEVWADLQALLKRWNEPARGYTARMAAETDHFANPYDQLSRYGEWDLSQRPAPEDMA